MNIAICDDEPEFNTRLIKCIKRTALYEKGWRIETFTGCEQLLFRYEDNHSPFELIFLDIKLPHTNGIDAGIAIRHRDPFATIVYVTNYAEYALAAYKANPFNYMMKPVNFAEFNAAFPKICAAAVRKRSRCLLVQQRSECKVVPVDQILYVESFSHNLQIHLIGGETLHYYNTLKKIMEDLGKYQFYQIHKSFIVNLLYIERVSFAQRQLTLEDGTVLSISRHRLAGFQEKLFEIHSSEVRDDVGTL